MAEARPPMYQFAPDNAWYEYAQPTPAAEP